MIKLHNIPLKVNNVNESKTLVIGICKSSHIVITKYQEEALPKLRKYLEEKSKEEEAIPKLKKYLKENH